MKIFWTKEIEKKITKQSYDYKGFASSYAADNLNSFNPELQLEDSEEPVIRSKLMVFITEFRWF